MPLSVVLAVFDAPSISLFPFVRDFFDGCLLQVHVVLFIFILASMLFHLKMKYQALLYRRSYEFFGINQSLLAQRADIRFFYRHSEISQARQGAGRRVCMVVVYVYVCMVCMRSEACHEQVGQEMCSKRSFLRGKSSDEKKTKKNNDNCDKRNPAVVCLINSYSRFFTKY